MRDLPWHECKRFEHIEREGERERETATNIQCKRFEHIDSIHVDFSDGWQGKDSWQSLIVSDCLNPSSALAGAGDFSGPHGSARHEKLLVVPSLAVAELAAPQSCTVVQGLGSFRSSQDARAHQDVQSLVT